MRAVVVLAEAAEDIEQARDFYDALDPGVGDYCADSLLADIESLALYHGIHSRQFGFHRMLAHRFPFGIYYRETKPGQRCSPCSTCGATQIGFARNWLGDPDDALLPIAFKTGKVAALNFLKGQVMKLSKGKANPGVAGEILERKLKG